TGLRIIVRGFSFMIASRSARRTILGSQTDWHDGLVAMSPQKVLPAYISKCSRIGPRLSAGKKVSAPTIKTTPINSAVKSGVVTGNVPSEGGTYFLRARFP